MKKSLLILIILSFMTTVAYAENNEDNIQDVLKQLNIVNDNTFVDANFVARGECLTVIMRSIGLNDEQVSNYAGDYVAFADTPAYSYYGCAKRSGIAYGEECAVSSPTYRTTHTGKNTDYFFFPDRNITIKECIAFMIRCLEPEKIGLTDAVKSAEQYEIIKNSDEFYQNMDVNLTQEDFFILLERFVKQNRYKYYSYNSYMNGETDEEHAMTYYEYLKGI